mmetsp:Transcript_47870/g.91518  ORF Transcript_47870/g.91518 Transcript_47870/m.91518 type:complete len:207 (-) Transcript_47870:851-1471(-)
MGNGCSFDLLSLPIGSSICRWFDVVEGCLRGRRLAHAQPAQSVCNSRSGFGSDRGSFLVRNFFVCPLAFLATRFRRVCIVLLGYLASIGGCMIAPAPLRRGLAVVMLSEHVPERLGVLVGVHRRCLPGWSVGLHQLFQSHFLRHERGGGLRDDLGGVGCYVGRCGCYAGLGGGPLQRSEDVFARIAQRHGSYAPHGRQRLRQPNLA